MTLKIPDSMDELVYWTSRVVGDGKVKAWAEREMCPACGKSLMGKPRGDNGSIKIRAAYYECPDCHHKVDKAEYEETLTVSIIYTCPKCKNSGETQVPYKRKKVQGVDAIIFQCQKCNEKIPITKKMKGLKEKD
jgi:hypothetical protein